MQAFGRRGFLIAMLGLWAGSGASQAAAETPARQVWSFEATVIRVSDGDTVWVRPDAGAPVKLRLVGIDAPERCQAHGEAAMRALSRRVLERRVRVEARARDDYGRWLARLLLDGEDVNGWLVTTGHAWGLRPGRRRGVYASQHRRAQAARQGLFADPSPVSPWEFRRDHGPCP